MNIKNDSIPLPPIEGKKGDEKSFIKKSEKDSRVSEVLQKIKEYEQLDLSYIKLENRIKTRKIDLYQTQSSKKKQNSLDRQQSFKKNEGAAELEGLEKQKKEIKDQLDSLQKELLGEIENQATYLLNQSNFTSDELDFIFRSENRLRSYLKKNRLSNSDPTYQRVEAFSKRGLFKLYKKAQSFIVKQPQHALNSEIAVKRKILSKAIETTRSFIKRGIKLQGKNTSNQEVFIERDTVYKKGNKRAKEEEQLIQSLSSLMAENGGGVVSSFPLRELSLQRFGIDIISYEDKTRGYSLIPKEMALENPTSQNLKDIFNISTQNVLDQLLGLLNPTHFDLFDRLNNENDDYQSYANTEWVIEENQQELHLSFDQLRDYYQRNLLNPSTLIRRKGEQNYSHFYNKQQKDPKFFKALQYVPFSQNIFFVPSFTSQSDQVNYEKWEKLRWSFKVGDQTYTGTFKDIQNCILSGVKLLEIQALNSSNSQPLEKQPSLNEVINVIENIKWNLINSQVSKNIRLQNYLHLQEKYNNWNSMKWSYEIQGKIYINSFKEIIQKNKDRLSQVMNLKACDSQGYPLDNEHQPSLQEINEVLDALKNAHIAPFSLKETYDAWNLMQWSYDIEGHQYMSPFKHVEQLIHKGMNLTNLMAYDSQNHPLVNQPSLDNINTVLNAIYGELGVIPVENIDVKPFELMVTPYNLGLTLTDQLLNRLTPQAQANSILSGELQFLDLHENNIGLKPSHVIDEKFFQMSFYYNNPSEDPNKALEAKTFNDLLKDFLQNQIDSNTEITYEVGHPSISITSKIKDILGLDDVLNKIVNGSWEFAFFDTDLCLGEDNELQVIILAGEEGSLIPLNSHLLQMDWKDVPLSKEALTILQNRSERDKQTEKWIKREDAGIRRRLTQEAREELDKKLEPLLMHPYYNLSHNRREDAWGRVTVNEIRQKFAKDLSAHKENEIWGFLQGELSQVKIRKGETWESIAKRYKQDIQALKKLNRDQPFIEGGQIKIEVDLVSDTPEAQQQRTQIALDLFPRLTGKQQQALLERMNSRKTYLENYNKLKELKTDNPNKIRLACQEFLKKSPLNTIKHKEFSGRLLNRSNDLHLIKEELLKECQPTYFNFMCIMCPLLADAYCLIKYESKIFNIKDVGSRIGSYNNRLENIIDNVKQDTYDKLIQFQSGPDTSYLKNPEFHTVVQLSDLADKFENKIKNKQDPNFLGRFG
jgi:hypothetical protein